jgi:hypothetical protein
MKKTGKIILVISLLFHISCSRVDIEENPLLFFWNEMDRRYVFFEEKHINWDSVKNTLHLYNTNDDSELLYAFRKMTGILNDNHVWVHWANQSSVSDTKMMDMSNDDVDGNDEYDPYSLDYNYNRSDIDLEKYSASNIITIGNEYKIAQLQSNIVYLEMCSFVNSSSVIELLKNYNYTKGIIIDIRRHGGGSVNDLLETSSCFIKGTHNVLYVKYKKSRRHDDFTDYRPISIAGKNKFDETNLLIIIDAGTYSAANLFTSILKNLTNAVLVGNKTGGGGAIGNRGILPNGWIYSISENKYYDSEFGLLEFGVQPDYLIVYAKEEDDEFMITGYHNQMDFAFSYLLRNEK